MQFHPPPEATGRFLSSTGWSHWRPVEVCSSTRGKPPHLPPSLRVRSRRWNPTSWPEDRKSARKKNRGRREGSYWVLFICVFFESLKWVVETESKQNTDLISQKWACMTPKKSWGPWINWYPGAVENSYGKPTICGSNPRSSIVSWYHVYWRVFRISWWHLQYPSSSMQGGAQSDRCLN